MRLEVGGAVLEGDWLATGPARCSSTSSRRAGGPSAPTSCCTRSGRSPDGTPAATNVRQAVHALRDRLEPGRERQAPSRYVAGRRGGGYELAAGAVLVDADAFAAAAEAGPARALRDGDARAPRPRWRAPRRSTAGTSWPTSRTPSGRSPSATRLRALAGRVLRALAGVRVRAGELDAASEQLQRLAELEPLDVEAQRQLLTLLLRCGRRSEAARRYEVVRRRFRRAFGEEPSFELAELARRRRSRDGGDRAPLTSFIGWGVLAVALAFASSLSLGHRRLHRRPAVARAALVTVLLVAQVGGGGARSRSCSARATRSPSSGPALLAIAAGVAGCARAGGVLPRAGDRDDEHRRAGLGHRRRGARAGRAGLRRAARRRSRSRASSSRMVGIMLAAREPADAAPAATLRRRVGLALLAALGFGSFFVLLDRATEDGGVAVVDPARARRARCLLLARSPSCSAPAMPTGLRDVGPLLLIGALDYLANGLLRARHHEGAAQRRRGGRLALPRRHRRARPRVLAERVARSQEIGVVATLAGVAAISAG